MVNNLKIIDCDIIYLSYDEPNAEKNYADLCSKIPWAKRVHGVKGSDAAHKACANLSETDRFITIDGDNIIDQSFLEQEFNLSNYNLEKCVISWRGLNIINGLMYGNGGIKCWPKEYVLKMRTHENADPSDIQSQVEFCWDTEYVQMNSCYSTVFNNATPQQAWRAGFREGVKLSLNRGLRVTKEDFTKLHQRCLQMLYIWMMIGMDVDNGIWAILGARYGLYKTLLTDWDYTSVRDFDCLNTLWEKKFKNIEEDQAYKECCKYTDLLSELEIPIGNPLSFKQSKFFKSVYHMPNRTNQQIVIDPE